MAKNDSSSMGPKFWTAVLWAVTAIILFHLLKLMVAGGLIDELAEFIRSFAPPPLQKLPIDAPLAFVFACLGWYSHPLAAFLKGMFPRFDTKVFRRIKRAQALDPLRGVVIPEQSKATFADDDMAVTPPPPIPFPFEKPRPNNPARHQAWVALEAFVGRKSLSTSETNGHPSDFAWTVVVGPSGIGKSRLVLEFARELAGRSDLGGAQPTASTLRRMFYSALTWIRRSSVTHPWDAGWLENAPPTAGSELTRTQLRKMEALSRWRPRKPTFILLDDPLTGDAEKVIGQLLKNADVDAFKFAVRLVIVCPSIPNELKFVARHGLDQSEVAGFHGPPIVLGENAGFDIEEVRRLSHKPGFKQWLPAEILAASPTDWGNRYTESIRKILIITEGNPFLLERLIIAMQRGVAVEQLDKGFLLRERAENLLRALRISGLNEAYLPLLAAATLARGSDELTINQRRTLMANFPTIDLSQKAESRAIRHALPASGSELDLWLPAVVPRLVGREFVRACLSELHNKESAAKAIVSAAWRTSPNAVLEAALAERAEGKDDILTRVLTAGPPLEAGMSAYQVVAAYMTATLVVSRINWDLGAHDDADLLMEDTLRLVSELPDNESRKAIGHLASLTKLPRHKHIFRSIRGVQVLAGLAERLRVSSSDADRQIAQDFWTVYRAAVDISDSWGLDFADPATVQLILSLRELLALIPSDDLLSAEIEAELWRLAIRNGLIGGLVAVFMKVCELQSSLDLLVYAHVYSTTQSFCFVTERSQHPPFPEVRRAAFARFASDVPQPDRLTLLTSIMAMSCLTPDRINEALEQSLRWIDLAPIETIERLPLRALAYRVAVLVHPSVECWTQAMEEVSAGLSTTVSTGTTSLLGVLYGLVPEEPGRDPSRADMETIQSALLRPDLSLDALECLFLALLSLIGRCAIEDGPLEAQSFRAASDDVVAWLRESSGRWVGHLTLEVQFAHALTHRSRAFRFNPKETREAARQVTHRLRPFGSSPYALVAVANAWAIHTYARSDELSDDALSELESIVDYLDRLVWSQARAQTAGYTATLSQSLSCHYDCITVLQNKGLDCTAAMLRQVRALPPDLHSSQSQKCLATSLWCLAANERAERALREAAFIYAAVIQYWIGGAPDPVEPVPTKQDHGAARDLHMAMLPFLFHFVVGGAMENATNNGMFCSIIDEVVAAAGLDNEPEYQALRRQAWASLGAEPPSLRHAQPFGTAIDASLRTAPQGDRIEDYGCSRDA